MMESPQPDSTPQRDPNPAEQMQPAAQQQAGQDAPFEDIKLPTPEPKSDLTPEVPPVPEPTFADEFQTLLDSWRGSLSSAPSPVEFSEKDSQRLQEMMEILHTELLAHISRNPRVADDMAKQKAGIISPSEPPFIALDKKDGEVEVFGIPKFKGLVVQLGMLSKREIQGPAFPTTVLGVPVRYEFDTGFKLLGIHFGRTYCKDTEGKVAPLKPLI